MRVLCQASRKDRLYTYGQESQQFGDKSVRRGETEEYHLPVTLLKTILIQGQKIGHGKPLTGSPVDEDQATLKDCGD